MATRNELWRKRVLNAHVPTYFKANLIEASTRKLIVGFDGTRSVSYRYSFSDPGYHLGIHIESYVEEKPLEELDSIFDQFLEGYTFEEATEIFSNDELEKLFPELHKWLTVHMNGFYVLVPTRRKKNFLKGFCQGVARGR